MGKELTREDMVRVLNQGRTVIHKGKAIRSILDLPSAIQLAGDNEEAKAAARAKIQAEMAALQAQLDEADAPKQEKASADDKPSDEPPADDKPSGKPKAQGKADEEPKP